jgi:chromosome transmission fidelity protein 18
MPYLSQTALVFHNLFSCPLRYNTRKPLDKDNEEVAKPFSGPRADYEAYEAQKLNHSILQSFHSSLPAPLMSTFRSPESVAFELVPYALRLLSPNVTPVVVRGSDANTTTATVRKESERKLVERAAALMAELGVAFEKGKIEFEETGQQGGLILRMEP